MVIDASAVIAILPAEDDAERYTHAIEAAAGEPFAICERAFVYRGDSNLRSSGRAGLEGDSESLAGANELIRAGGHDEAEAA